jgi:hypothetical protein
MKAKYKGLMAAMIFILGIVNTSFAGDGKTFTLQECIATALTQNPLIKSSESDIEAATRTKNALAFFMGVQPESIGDIVGTLAADENIRQPEEYELIKSRPDILVLSKKAEQAKRKNLLALMRQDNTDRNAITAVVSELSGLQEEMQRMIDMHMLDMKAGLDKEQQKEFLDLIENTMTQGRQPVCPPN